MSNKCFALKSKSCQVLNIRKLQCNKCSLRKTTEELDESQRMANARLASLPKEHQIQIADKYYSGEMPWLGGR